jgi:hypothetical protein
MPQIDTLTIRDAARQAGGNPKARSQAITQRAANIQIAGPQDQAFQTAVDNANCDLQVTQPAEAVAAAYAKGGAQAAAEELKTVTQNAGNSYYAGQIIQASQGTIDSITKDMGALASNAPMPNRTSFIEPSTTATEFNLIYTDLSQSVEAANTITISGSGAKTQVTLSADGKAAADIVANSIAQNAPKNLKAWQSALYDNGAGYAIASGNGDGDGAALTLATVAALKRQGNSDLVSHLVEGAANGIQWLGSQTQTDVTAFATTTDTLQTLRTTWGPFMSQTQLTDQGDQRLSGRPSGRPGDGRCSAGNDIAGRRRDRGSGSGMALLRRAAQWRRWTGGSFFSRQMLDRQ